MRNALHLPTYFKEMAYTNHLNLPRLPIPILKDTISRYLKSIQPLVSTAEYQQHQDLVENFIQTDGPKLHQTLIERDGKFENKDQFPYSYIEEDWFNMYLGGRYPSPINVNPGYGLIDEGEPSLQDSITRTATFITSMLKFITKMKTNKLEPDQGPLCMSTFPQQFGTTRVPHQAMDQLEYYPESSHIVVMCDEYYYKIRVFSPDGNQRISTDGLMEQLKYVYEKTSNKPKAPKLSTFTADERDYWASVRIELLESEKNHKSLRDIDTALCVLVLETRTPKNVADRSNLTLHGHGSNRWFDKLQIISYLDGHIGINFEHSFSDGTAWNRWLHEVWHDMRQTDSGFQPLPFMKTFDSLSSPEELSWDLSNQLLDKAEQSFERIKDLSSKNQTEFTEFDLFGKNEIKKWKLSPDGVVQMGLQLAFYQQYGKMAPTYESCATRSYLHGRTETIRSATNEAHQFVKSMTDSQNMSKEEKRKLFQEAVSKHIEMAKAAQQGQGVDRHLFALSSIAHSENNVHPFFTDSIRNMSSSFRISSSNVTMPFLQYFCFGAVVPNGYGVGYLIQPDKIPFNLTSFTDCQDTDSVAFKQSIEKSLKQIQQLHH